MTNARTTCSLLRSCQAGQTSKWAATLAFVLLHILLYWFLPYRHFSCTNYICKVRDVCNSVNTRCQTWFYTTIQRGIKMNNLPLEFNWNNKQFIGQDITYFNTSKCSSQFPQNPTNRLSPLYIMLQLKLQLLLHCSINPVLKAVKAQKCEYLSMLINHNEKAIQCPYYVALFVTPFPELKEKHRWLRVYMFMIITRNMQDSVKYMHLKKDQRIQ